MFPIYITNECKKKLMTQLPCDYLVLHFLTFGTVLSTHTNTNTLQCKRKSSKSSNVEINNLSSCCLETWRPPLDVAIHIENRNLVIMQLYTQFELKLMTLLCTRRRSSFLLGRYIFFCIQATTGVLARNRLPLPLPMMINVYKELENVYFSFLIFSLNHDLDEWLQQQQQ